MKMLRYEEIKNLPDQDQERYFSELSEIMAAEEKERAEKRMEMKRLTAGLLTYDSESLGDAVKCYISEKKNTRELTDTAYKAYRDLAEILILEMEC